MLIADDVVDVGYNWWEIAKIAFAALFVSAATFQIMRGRRDEF